MEIVLRIQLLGVTPNGESAIQVLAIPGGTAMPHTPVLAPAPQPENLADLLAQYLAWGRAQGGKRGQPWQKDHLRQTERRCGWWLEKLTAERASLGALPLTVVERLSPQVGRCFDRRGKVKPVAPKTRKDYLAALLTWRTWAEKRDLIRIPVPDPLRALRKPSGDPETEWRGLTPGEFQALLHAAPLNRREIYAVMALTGLRRREFRELKAGYLDRASQSLVIPASATKNGKPARIPLPPQVYPLVAARAARKDADEDLYVFSKDALTRFFVSDCAAAGIERITPEGKATLHGMRDTASTVLQQLGYSLSLASKFCRHGDERLTRKRYTQVRAAELADAGAALGEKLGVGGMLQPVRGMRSVPDPQHPNPAPQVQHSQQPATLNMVGAEGFEPHLPPIVIVNLVNTRDSEFPQKTPDALGGFVGELCAVLLPLPAERAAEARAGLLAVARAYAAIPAGQNVKLTTQLLQVDQSALPEAAPSSASVPAEAEGRAMPAEHEGGVA